MPSKDESQRLSVALTNRSIFVLHCHINRWTCQGQQKLIKRRWNSCCTHDGHKQGEKINLGSSLKLWWSWNLIHRQMTVAALMAIKFFVQMYRRFIYTKEVPGKFWTPVMNPLHKWGYNAGILNGSMIWQPSRWESSCVWRRILIGM